MSDKSPLTSKTLSHEAKAEHVNHDVHEHHDKPAHPEHEHHHEGTCSCCAHDHDHHEHHEHDHHEHDHHEHDHHEHHHHDGSCSCCSHDHGDEHHHHHDIAQHQDSDDLINSAAKKARLHVAQMCCAVEGELAANALRKDPMVVGVSYNTLNRTIDVGHNFQDDTALLDILAKVGLTATLMQESDTATRVRWRIEEIQTQVHVRALEEALSELPVKDIVCDTRLHSMSLIAKPSDMAAVEHALTQAGFTPIRIADSSKVLQERPKIAWARLSVAGLFALASEAVHWFEADYRLGIACAVAAIIIAGFTTYRRGLSALSHGNFNMNALMSVAVTGALLIGYWPEAAMVMVLFEVSEAIEALSIDRAHRAIAGLMNLTPQQAVRVMSDGHGETVPVSDIIVGDLIRVAPGESIALDGEVVEGNSSVMQAAMTGESLPVQKMPGSAVWGGTVNETAELTIRVTHDASHGMSAKIIEAVEAANRFKAPTERFVDVFARYYTPAVFVLSILTATIPPLFLGADFLEWLYKALVLLVIACPCALVISTPVTVVSGLAVAARLGMIIKGGAALEQARRIQTIALDKTGTITQGVPQVTQVVALGMADEKSVLTIGAALAARSTHPISQALLRYAQSQGITPAAVTAFEQIPGTGTRALLEGSPVQLISPKAATLEPSVFQAIQERLNVGESCVVVTDILGPVGYILVADTLRANARYTLAHLSDMGIKTVLLTGDNAKSAKAMAHRVGIESVQADLLPQDKLNAIEQLQKTGPVAMVGDGINDAPALAKANLSVAMARGGSDIAIDTAQVALMDDDIFKLVQLIQLSRATHRRLIENITLALGVKLVFMILTFMGLATMWMAVFADIGICLIVVAWGMSIMREETKLRRLADPDHADTCSKGCCCGG